MPRQCLREAKPAQGLRSRTPRGCTTPSMTPTAVHAEWSGAAQGTPPWAASAEGLRKAWSREPETASSSPRQTPGSMRHIPPPSPGTQPLAAASMPPFTRVLGRPAGGSGCAAAGNQRCAKLCLQSRRTHRGSLPADKPATSRLAPRFRAHDCASRYAPQLWRTSRTAWRTRGTPRPSATRTRGRPDSCGCRQPRRRSVTSRHLKRRTRRSCPLKTS